MRRSVRRNYRSSVVDHEGLRRPSDDTRLPCPNAGTEVTASEREPSFAGPPRCVRCGGVIGVYEPLVLVSRDTIRITSRAAEPNVGYEVGASYHSACRPPSPASGMDGTSPASGQA